MQSYQGPEKFEIWRYKQGRSQCKNEVSCLKNDKKKG